MFLDLGDSPLHFGHPWENFGLGSGQESLGHIMDGATKTLRGKKRWLLSFKTPVLFDWILILTISALWARRGACAAGVRLQEPSTVSLVIGHLRVLIYTEEMGHLW